MNEKAKEGESNNDSITQSIIYCTHVSRFSWMSLYIS